MSNYDFGDRRKLACQIRNEAGDLADPEALFLQIRTPDKETITYRYGTDSELVREGTGSFHMYWDCTQAGVHHLRWAATGALSVAKESWFVVNNTGFGPFPT